MWPAPYSFITFGFWLEFPCFISYSLLHCLHCIWSVLAPMLDWRVKFHVVVSGCFSPSAYQCQGALALPFAMSALLWWFALLVGMAVGSLHDDEPMQADELLIVRGDAPRGLFTSSLGRAATDLWDWTSSGASKWNLHPQAASWSWDPPYAAVGESGGHTRPLARWTCWWHHRLVWWPKG